MMNLIHDAKFVVVEASAIAGTTTLTTDVVDLAGFDSVAFVAHLGDVTDTSVLTLTGYTNDTNNTTTPTETAAAVTFTAGASDADNKLMVVDMVKPRQRYAYATLERGTANAVVNGIVAILYNAHNKPVTQPASVLVADVFNDPNNAA
ncbi:hypothetical protein ACTZWW_04190 [Salinarimonas sp. NSM]|uniref:hypothetical protein n=1 Tax=Salinarimonas sp. NSM TaxID=3458003 RepID=UPI004035D3A7